MLRPRDSHDLKVIEEQIEISPSPIALRWIHDVFGNSVGIARFAGRSRRLVFDSTVKIRHAPTHGLDLTKDDVSYLYPFAYDDEEMPDLARSIERQYPDPERIIDTWARQFVEPAGPTRTQDLLTDMTLAIKQRFGYARRLKSGVQEPIETLRLRTGTCRDFALLMIEAARSLGLAARFVSGYLYSPGACSDERVGAGSTHAWAQVYLPDAGWVEFDPTNGIVGNRDLIRVAVAREPRQAVPLWGTYMGSASDHLGMAVEVNVISDAGGSTENQDRCRSEQATTSPSRLRSARR